MASKLYCELRKLCSATRLKTSLAKYWKEFNDLAVKMRPHGIAYFLKYAIPCGRICTAKSLNSIQYRQLGRPYTTLYARRSVGRLREYQN